MKKIALLLYTVIVLVLAASCDRRAEYLTAVSYTHLTLPTICSV